MIHFLAYTIITLQAINVVMMPSLFGEERKPYGYSHFVAAIISALIVTPVAYYALTH